MMTIPIATRVFEGEVPAMDALAERLETELVGGEFKRHDYALHDSEGLDLVNFISFGHPGPFDVHNLDVQWRGEQLSIQHMAPLKRVTVDGSGGIKAFEQVVKVLEEMGGRAPVRAAAAPEIKNIRRRRTLVAIVFRLVIFLMVVWVWWSFGIWWALLSGVAGWVIWMIVSMLLMIVLSLSAGPAQLKRAQVGLDEWYRKNGRGSALPGG